VQWGAWTSVGMAAQTAAVLARIERSGMGVLKPAAGLKLLHAMLTNSGQSAAQVRGCVQQLCGDDTSMPLRGWLHAEVNI